MIYYPNEYQSFIFVTRVTRLIHNAGKYLLISIYPLPTHPTHNFTHKNGGNLDTLPGWPKKLHLNRPARCAGQLKRTARYWNRIKLCPVKQRNCCETKAGSGSMLPEHIGPQPAYGYRNSDGMLPKLRRNFTRPSFAPRGIYRSKKLGLKLTLSAHPLALCEEIDNSSINGIDL